MTILALGGEGQSLVIDARAPGPSVLHWGAAVPARDLDGLADALRPDITGAMLDATPPISLCPQASQTFPGQPGLVIRAADGASLSPSFRAVDAETDAATAVFASEDFGLNLRLSFHFSYEPHSNVITAQTRLSSSRPVRIDWLAAPVMPAPQQCDHMIDYAGAWISEFQPQMTPWTPGIRLRESRTGRTGHEHFPALILPGFGATNTQGEVWALHYGWSGGHRMIAEELPDGRRHVQFGHAIGSETEPGTEFASAPLYLAYSKQGLNGIAAAYQTHLRDHIVDWPAPAQPRPVHYNCWEAVYFRHDVDELKVIATRAAAMGAERFVLDDGWFGRRDNDTTSLGDWDIDPRKFPDGLGPLIAHIEALDMRFGIWFEPEMVNLDSDLARAHPEWILGAADQLEGRQQRVLNMARPDVCDYLYEKISTILLAYPVDYVKWDHNRVLPVVDAAQARGTYDLLDRLRAAFPETEIESCASGGGRIDFGILSRTQRVWLSDSNDALERLRMQHEAALFLPWEVIGSHVGPRMCHTSGRVHDIRFRAWVAAQRHMGFEMDPRELTEDEADVLTRVTAWWKSARGWRAGATIHRLDSADPSVVAEQQIAKDGTVFVIFVGQADSSAQIVPRPLRLTGLEPDAQYRITLVNRDDLSKLSRGAPVLKSGPVTLSGQSLMQVGLTLPYALPASIWVLEGEKL